MSSTATASRSQRRSTVGSPSWFACARRRSRISSVSGTESGTSPMCWTSITCLRWSSSSVTSRPRSWPWSASSSTNVSAPAVSRSTTKSQIRKRASSSTAPSSWSTDCTDTLPSVADESWSSVETASRKLPRADRATRARAASGRFDAFALGYPLQVAHDLRQAGPREHERLAARPDSRQHLLELGRAEDEDEMRGRLLDQLQQRVEGGVR